MLEKIVREAIYSDGTDYYCSPMEADLYDNIRIRIRVGNNNVDKVVLVVNHMLRYTMMKIESDDYFDYYEYELYLDTKRLRYYFEISLDNEIVYYNRLGVRDDILSYKYHFGLNAGYHTPTWAKGKIIYQIMVDRFYNGNKENDVLNDEYSYLGMMSYRKENWEEKPSVFANPEFYGGDLDGVIEKLDYLAYLGIDCIYFNPIFVSPSNHKYDIQDYEGVDPHFGRIIDDDGELLDEEIPPVNNKNSTKYISRVTSKRNLSASNELLRELVEKAHEKGIAVILDGVFNHCGSFNKWLDEALIYDNIDGYEKGAFIHKDSPYNSYFRFTNDEWPYNYSYDGWWGYKTLPKLNYEGSNELFEKIMGIAQKWVNKPYNIDGWRLDVAADLGYSSEFNHYFWKVFRNRVKEINPQALIIAEHYGSASDYLGNNEWDTIMNYDAFMEPISYYLTGMEKHSDNYIEGLLGNTDSFIDSMSYAMADFPYGSLYIAMNELSNHDHSRFLTRTNKVVGRVSELGYEMAEYNVNKAVFRIAVVMQMTWIGCPTIYYGDEAGLVGFTDPDNRRTYPWGNEDKELIEFHRDIIALRKRNPALIDGGLKFIYRDYKVLAYGRFNDRNKLVIVINNNDCATDVNLPVWELGFMKNDSVYLSFITFKNGYYKDDVELYQFNGRVNIHIEEFSAIILSNYR